METELENTSQVKVLTPGLTPNTRDNIDAIPADSITRFIHSLIMKKEARSRTNKQWE